MSLSEVIVDGQLFRLGRRVGKGGEGVVYAIGDDSQYAVKIYSTSDSASKESKILAMVRANLAVQAPLVAFPKSIAKSKNGKFVGFVMKLINEHKPLHDLYAPGSRKNHFPHADYRFLVRTASNFARSVASVHQSKCVIGDINHSGILVSPKATVSLIDADSFQFFESGQRYLCKVGVPEYTPPELQGKSLAGIERTPNHDSFGLAVVIFQLLFMGRHPFVGTVRHGDIPPLHENIQHFRYVYAENRDVGMDQPPGTPALSDFSPGVAKLFDTAFSKVSADRRPTAEQWVKQLDELESSLTQCQDNPLHYAPRDASECAWCEMDRQLGTFLFLPYIPGAKLKSEGFDPGVGGFNLDLIWVKIEAVVQSVPNNPNPKVTSAQVTPSEKAMNARNTGNPWGFLLAGAALWILIVAPKLWFLWIPLAYWGYGMIKGSDSIDSSPFTQAYIDAANRWNKAIQEWYLRIGYIDFVAAKSELTESRVTYLRLAEEERGLLTKYQHERRERQLHAFLDQFDIQHSQIRGIGPAKQAVLASYGIDTVADISLSRLLAVPGFGQTTSQGLLEWRAKHEKRFVYLSQINDSDRQEIARIRSSIEAKASPLRRKLSVGPHNIEQLAKRVKDSLSIVDPTLIQVQRQREQTKCDLEYLSISIPHVPTNSTVQPTNTNASNRTSQNYTSSTSSPRCPRCNSTMIQRIARRGRNAGGSFWGCSRYPSCKGTRNI
jgi:DNA-binding helix-hairpin-helix protein with protein kinase domain